MEAITNDKGGFGMKTTNARHSGLLYILVSREQLEELAIKAICACWYYDLSDMLEVATDAELIKIIEREPCIACE
jgi:hypothetical protein